MAEPQRTRAFITTAMVATVTVFTVLATGFVALRIYATRHIKTSLLRSTDLWLILVGLLFSWGGWIAMICGAAIGGIDWNKLPPEQAVALTEKISWSNAFLFAPASAFTKLSILEFYKKIFPSPKFHLACHVHEFNVSGWMVAYIVAQFLCEDPWNAAWTPGPNRLRFDYTTFNLAMAGIDIGLDLITLCLPLFVISRLQMSTSRKIKIAAIFWIGAFCVVCAAVRLYYADTAVRLADEGTNRDTTSILSLADLWARLEPLVAIIAACMLTLGPILPDGRRLASIVASVRSLVSLNSRDSRDGRGSSTGSGGAQNRNQATMVDGTQNSSTTRNDSIPLQNLRKQSVPTEDSRAGSSSTNEGTAHTLEIDGTHQIHA